MTNDVNPIEFGRVIGHLEAIRGELKELKERTVWRLDDIEARVEVLEKYKEVDSKPRFADQLAEKIIWAALAALGALILNGVM